MKTLKYSDTSMFAPRASTHLILATALTVLLGLVVLAAEALAIGPVNIPGPLHPDPLAYAVCGGQLDDFVAGRTNGTTTIILDEGEGRAFKRIVRGACAEGWTVIIVTPEFFWTGAGIDIDPERGGWIKPNIIKQGAR